MRPDLLAGTAALTIQGEVVPLRLVEEGVEWLWVDRAGKILAQGGSWTGAIGDLLLAYGDHSFGLVFTVMASGDAAGLCDPKNATMEPDPPNTRHPAARPEPPVAPRQRTLF